jgi:hypothetical protein
MNFRLFPGALVLLGGFAATPVVAQTTVNPFEVSSTLPFQAPRFDIIKDSDYQPAFDEAIKRQLAEVDAIANSSGKVRSHAGPCQRDLLRRGPGQFQH